MIRPRRRAHPLYDPFMSLRFPVAALLLSALGCASARPALEHASGGTQMTHVRSKDGTNIALECTGTGPSLILVHGGIGDRTRWTPMFSLLSSSFTVCAMDRRGRGGSTDADSGGYSLTKEAEDVAAVAESREGDVFVLGHSYGGVCALEAAFLTRRISKLILYEPPVRDRTDPAVIERIERLIQTDEREEAMSAFLGDIVKVPPSELAAMRSRPAWPQLVATIDYQPRQMRALAAYRLDPARMSSLRVPTLLLLGGETRSAEMKEGIHDLKGALPHASVVVLEGQRHNAMDTGREMMAAAIVEFLGAARE